MSNVPGRGRRARWIGEVEGDWVRKEKKREVSSRVEDTRDRDSILTSGSNLI